jgi:flagellar protein FliO/FliZ
MNPCIEPAARTRRALRALLLAALVCLAPPLLAQAPAAAQSAAAGLPAPTVPAAGAAPRPVEGPSFAPMGVSLVLVLGLMAAVLWAMRRAGLAPRPGTPGLLRLVGQLPLGPRERLVIVEAGERWLLLGIGAAGISRLASLPKTEVGAQAAAPATFVSLLERLRKGSA